MLNHQGTKARRKTLCLCVFVVKEIVKQHLCRVVENRLLWSSVQLLTLDAPGLAMRPGQFALARDPSTFDPYLRRTMWLYRLERERGTFTLPAHDPLAARARIGDTLDLLAPIGRAVEFDANARHILLIGEGARLAPLLAIADSAISQQREVVLVWRGADAFPAHLLAPEIEYRTDASALGDELLTWADAIVASGTDELYRTLADSARAARYRLEPGLARVLIDLPMPCGTGDCYVCAVETRHGIQLACIDGPAFDLADLKIGERGEPFHR
jgi:dihydroorotate dehydrogenase electron transfer subunit